MTLEERHEPEAQMGQLTEPLCDDVGKVTIPKAPSLCGTPVEVLTEVRREEALLSSKSLARSKTARIAWALVWD
jgi:hypothetical protein